MAASQAADGNVEIHLGECKRGDTSGETRRAFANAARLRSIKMGSGIFKVALSRSAAVNDLSAKFVLGDVGGFLGQIVCPHIETKEDRVADKATQPLRALNLELHDSPLHGMVESF